MCCVHHRAAPLLSARTMLDEEPHTSRVGRSPQHEGDSEERYQRQC
jgi:hypothetical protein